MKRFFLQGWISRKQYFQIVNMGYKVITLPDLSTNFIRNEPFKT